MSARKTEPLVNTSIWYLQKWWLRRNSLKCLDVKERERVRDESGYSL